MSTVSDLPEWANASDLSGGGEWFRPADYEGSLVVFHAFTQSPSQDQWGNDYATGTIIVMDAEDGPVLYQGETATLKGNLMRRVTGEAFAIGRLAKGKPKGGNNAPWILEDATEAEMKAARASWVKMMELDSAGRWVPIADPNEAPF